MLVTRRAARSSTPSRISLDVVATTGALGPLRSAVRDGLIELGVDRAGCVAVASELVAALADERPGQPVEVELARRGAELTLTIRAAGTAPTDLDDLRRRIIASLSDDDHQQFDVDDRHIVVCFDLTDGS